MKLDFKEKAIQVQKNIQYNQVCFFLHLYDCLKNEEGIYNSRIHTFYLFIYLFIYSPNNYKSPNNYICIIKLLHVCNIFIVLRCLDLPSFKAELFVALVKD